MTRRNETGQDVSGAEFITERGKRMPVDDRAKAKAELAQVWAEVRRFHDREYPRTREALEECARESAALGEKVKRCNDALNKACLDYIEARKAKP